MNNTQEWFKMLSVTLGLLTWCLLCCWGEGVPVLPPPRVGPANGADAAPRGCGAVYRHSRPGLILLNTFHAQGEEGTSEQR